MCVKICPIEYMNDEWFGRYDSVRVYCLHLALYYMSMVMILLMIIKVYDFNQIVTVKESDKILVLQNSSSFMLDFWIKWIMTVPAC